MLFLLITIFLFLISFLAAFFSLKKEQSKPKEVEHVKRELSREKILYKA